jgi:hypothetical protein
MTTNVVADEQLGAFARRQNDLFRRVRDGSLPIERVMHALQQIIEGNFDGLPQTGLNRLIDADAQPYIPDGWAIEEHQKGGEIEFDPKKVEFYLSPNQTGDQSVNGKKLREELKGKKVLNACVLDHLMANTNLIPESWKQDGDGNTRYIYFWGTVYRVSDGDLCVRYLCWDGGQWSWRCYALADDWRSQRPAAVSAS